MLEILATIALVPYAIGGIYFAIMIIWAIKLLISNKDTPK